MTTYTWFGGNGSYSTSSSWLPQGVPGQDDIAVINGGAVTDPSNITSSSSSTSSGSLQLSGPAASLTTTQGVDIGYVGTATMVVGGGAVLTNTGYNAAGGAGGVYAIIGDTSSASGSATVTGPGSLWSNGGNSLVIGNTGTGTLTVANSGTVNDTYAVAVGQLTSATGTLTVQTGGTLTFGTSFIVGNQTGTSGVVTVSAGSTISDTSPSSLSNLSYLHIAQNSGTQGTVTVTGSGALLNLNNNALYVGDGGTGALNVTSGGVVDAGTADETVGGAFYVGFTNGAVGAVTVAGSGSILSAAGFADIGRGGTATLTVTNAGTAILGDASYTAEIGAGRPGNSGGTGTLLVSSGGIVSAVSNLIFGDGAATGNAVIGAGGVVIAGGQVGIATATTSANNVAGAGTVTVSAGGTLEAAATVAETGTAAIYVGNAPGVIGTLNVQGVGALVTANGYRISIGSGPSGQTVSGGTGLMTVSQGAQAAAGSVSSSYAALVIGTAQQSYGMLTVIDPGSLFTAAGRAVIGSYGTGSVLVANDATLLTGSTASGASSGLAIGGQAGATGTVTVAGSGSTISNVGAFAVGSGGVGSLTISGGGQVSTALIPSGTGDAADIGLGAGANGSTVQVSGAGSLWMVGGALGVGAAGTGTLSLNAGGTTSAGSANVGTGVGSGGVALSSGTLSVSGGLAVGVNGSVTGSGMVSAGQTTVSGLYGATGLLASPQVVVASGGILQPTGGALTVSGAVDGAGAIQIGNGDTLVFTGAVDAGAGDALTVGFTAAGGTLNLGAPAQFAAIISGYQSGDTVAVYDPTHGTVTASQSGGNTILSFADGTALTFAGMSAPAPNQIVFDTSVPCYCRGTLIAMEDGERPVEHLREGDLVRTAAGVLRPIRWIGRRSYAGRFLAANPNVHPVRFRAGSLGGGLPRRDLLVSPEHAMALDGLLVPAKCLVNLISIVQERARDRVDYFHVELETHDLLLAEGAPSESFLDDDSRGLFHNASEFAAVYSVAPGRSCAPKVTEGYALEAIRERLALVARELSAAA